MTRIASANIGSGRSASRWSAPATAGSARSTGDKITMGARYRAWRDALGKAER